MASCGSFSGGGAWTSTATWTSRPARGGGGAWTSTSVFLWKKQFLNIHKVGRLRYDKIIIKHYYKLMIKHAC